MILSKQNHEDDITKQHLNAIRQAKSTIEKQNALQDLLQCYGEDSAALLVTLLEDRDDEIRSIAFHGLSLVPSEKSAVLLATFLAHTDLHVRNLVAELLVQYKAMAVPALLRCLSNPNKKVRKFAIDILGLIGDLTVTPELAILLDKEQEPIVQVAIAEALGNLRAAEAVELLMRHIDSCPGMAPVVIDALGKINTQKSIGFLLEVLQRNDFYLSLFSLEALSNAFYPEIIDTLVERYKRIHPELKTNFFKTLCSIYQKLDPPPASKINFYRFKDDILKILKETENIQVFSSIFNSLPDDFIIKMFVQVLELLNHQNQDINYFVIERLKRLDKTEILIKLDQYLDSISARGHLALLNLIGDCDLVCAENILKKLGNSPIPEIRRVVAEVASVFNGAEFDYILIQLANDSVQLVRESAYLALSDRAYYDLIPIFEKGLESQVHSIFQVSLHTLARLSPGLLYNHLEKWLSVNDGERLLMFLSYMPENFFLSKPFLKTLLEHVNMKIRMYAIHAFETISEEVVQDWIAAGQEDKHPDVRLVALRAQIRQNAARAKVAISRALDDQDCRIQEVALEATKQLCLTEMLPQIYSLLGSSDRKVQLKAVQVIQELGGAKGITKARERLYNYGENADNIISLATDQNLFSVLNPDEAQ
ncbi:MAG: HEAT repeat domain-containing protein [candidate division KSB1 bacterium]|nr:HEAT repeat domain-containing protein [candidate division KSB1 bacterium]